MRLNRTFEWEVTTISISRELRLFNFERLDILCAWLGPPSENLWPFEFLESFLCWILFVSRASIIQFRASRFIMRLNRTSVWQFMTIWISRELPLFNFERLDILCAWLGPPSAKIWPFESLDSFRCSILSVSIYYVPESDLRVKC